MLLLSPGQCTRPDQSSSCHQENDVAQDTTAPTNGQDTVIVIDEAPEKFTHIDYMRAHIGVPAKDSINVWLASVGLPPGNPWCSAMASYALDVAKVQEPDVRSGLARNFVYKTPNSLQIQAAKVLRGEITAKRGWMVVYQRGNTIYGHNGFITKDWTGADGVYISGNTSPPSGGSEFSGGGVWEKPATIRPGSAFRITEFIIIKK